MKTGRAQAGGLKLSECACGGRDFTQPLPKRPDECPVKMVLGRTTPYFTRIIRSVWPNDPALSKEGVHTACPTMGFHAEVCRPGPSTSSQIVSTTFPRRSCSLSVALLAEANW